MSDAPALSVEAAIEAACAVAAQHGVPASAKVLADRSNLVLRVDAPGRPPFVARVAMATSLVRVGTTFVRREVEVARFLGLRGVPVTRPSAHPPAGPHERDELVLSFWELEPLLPTPPDPREVGRRLNAAHGALAAFPAATLPIWGGLTEAREVHARAVRLGVFTRDELLRLERAWERADAIVASVAARTMSFQAVHGDAHLGNVLSTDRGPVWADWEDAFVGPVEYDLACLRSKALLFGEEREAIDLATEAYGEVDRDLLADLLFVRNLQVIPWLAVFAEREPQLLARMRARLAFVP